MISVRFQLPPRQTQLFKKSCAGFILGIITTAHLPFAVLTLPYTLEKATIIKYSTNKVINDVNKKN
ncbi:MAG: hypothetical protein M1365_07505 [Actinobacteria bacterium]|nr:hypothetical protein [Actinomycetota bacterium]